MKTRAWVVMGIGALMGCGPSAPVSPRDQGRADASNVGVADAVGLPSDSGPRSRDGGSDSGTFEAMDGGVPAPALDGSLGDPELVASSLDGSIHQADVGDGYPDAAASPDSRPIEEPLPSEPAFGGLRASFASMGTNSQVFFPANLLLADVDDDGHQDLIQYAGNKFFVSALDAEQKGLQHAYLPESIVRIFAGHFTGRGTVVCATSVSHRLRCYRRGTDHAATLAWEQDLVIREDEDIVVADFDGNDRDDVLLYSRTSGSIRFLHGPSVLERLMPMSSRIHALVSASGPSITLRTGDFDANGRADLLFVDDAGVLSRFDLIDGPAGTSWVAKFSSLEPVVLASESISVARVDHGTGDDVVLYDGDAGSVRVFSFSHASGPLEEIDHGLTLPAGKRLAWARLRSSVDGFVEDHRDDFLLMDETTLRMERRDAAGNVRGVASYRSAFDVEMPARHLGWKMTEAKPWLILKCRFASRTRPPAEHRLDVPLRRIFGKGAAGGVQQYWADMSYGQWDLQRTVIDEDWHTLSFSYEKVAAVRHEDYSTWIGGSASKREIVWRDCVDVAHANPMEWAGIAVFQDRNGIDSGSLGPGTVIGDEWALIDFDGAAGAGGAGGTTWAVHEMGHGFGWAHTQDEDGNDYGDLWDIMSAMAVWKFRGDDGLHGGPAMAAPLRAMKNLIPAARIASLNAVGTQRVQIAALDQPESNGPMMVRLTDGADTYTIELRLKQGWDRAIPFDCVLVHRVVDDRARVITNGTLADMTAGDTKTLPTGTRITVESLDASRGTATIRIERD